MTNVRRNSAARIFPLLAVAIGILVAPSASGQAACPSVPPALIAPADGASAVPSPIEFRWNALAAGGAELLAYRVRVVLQSGEEVVIAETKETIAMAPLPAGTHAWFVEAIVAGCPPLVSSKNRFTVAEHVCPAQGPALLAPIDGAAGVASPVTFSWGEVAGAPAYRLMISIEGAPFEGRVTPERTATVFLPEKPIAWFVDTAPEGCPPVASPTFHFTVSGTPTCPTTAPELVIPPAGATISRGLTDPPVELVWTPVPGAVSYSLELLVNGNPLTIAGLKQPMFVAEGAIDLRNTAVEWFVRAHFEGCPPLESAHRQFTVTTPAACALSAPVAVSPPPDSRSASPVTHFAWTASPGAAEYRLWVKPEGLEPLVTAVMHGALEVEVVLDLGVYEWFVEAFREGCAPATSPPVRFTIEKSGTCEGARPRGLHPSPADAGLSSPVQFSWEAATGAVGYTVFLSHQGGRPTPLFDPSRPGELITATTLTAEVPPGESVWFVEAIFSGCPPAISEPIPFVVGGCDVKPPLLANPRPGGRVASPVDLLWTPVREATSYEVFASIDGASPQSLGTRTEPGLLAQLKTGGVVWWVQSTIERCGTVRSPESAFVVIDTPACGTPERPQVGAPGQVSSRAPYWIRWDSVPNAGSYEVEEALTPDFAGATRVNAPIGEAEFSHDVAADTAYYYRVRAVSSCESSTGEASAAARVVVLGPASSRAPAATADAGSSESMLRSVFIPGGSVAGTFRASSSTPWISLPVTTGTIPTGGLTLALTADPSALPFGTNQGEIKVEILGGGSTKDGERRTLDGTTTVTVPVSVTLVSAVTRGGKSAPPSDALIIPAVIHAPGAQGANFRSDVRVLNAGAQSTQVQVTFTPTASDGTVAGMRSSLSIGAGETTALDAVLKAWFGLASLGEAVSGSLEIRPLTVGASSSGPLGGKKTLSILGSSRTYNEASTGTYGQFIPAIPFREFVGGPTASGVSATKLSIQQIAHSSAYRTNLGLVEGAGESADVTVTVHDGTGASLTSFKKSLRPGEHVQLNSVLQGYTVDDGRFEIVVTSSTGKVYAYASVVDNLTNDPMLIHAVNLDEAATDRQTIAGVADYDTGLASWRTDVRLYNAGTSTETATLTFYPTLDPESAKTIQVTLDAGEIEQLDDVLDARFGVTNTGGAIHVTTAAAAKLVASARTYNQTSSGTYGQFIPAFREKDGIEKGDPPLQILQLEHSKNYRTNIGLFEMSGKKATVELTAVIPGSRVTPKVSVDLDPYEFIQLIGPLKSMGLSSAYNTRVSVRVKDGAGLVAAYASVIDENTQDPIYVPSQQ